MRFEAAFLCCILLGCSISSVAEAAAVSLQRSQILGQGMYVQGTGWYENNFYTTLTNYSSGESFLAWYAVDGDAWQQQGKIYVGQCNRTSAMMVATDLIYPAIYLACGTDGDILLQVALKTLAVSSILHPPPKTPPIIKSLTFPNLQTSIWTLTRNFLSQVDITNNNVLGDIGSEDLRIDGVNDKERYFFYSKLDHHTPPSFTEVLKLDISGKDWIYTAGITTSPYVLGNLVYVPELKAVLGLGNTWSAEISAFPSFFYFDADDLSVKANYTLPLAPPATSQGAYWDTTLSNYFALTQQSVVQISPEGKFIAQAIFPTTCPLNPQTSGCRVEPDSISVGRKKAFTYVATVNMYDSKGIPSGVIWTAN